MLRANDKVGPYTLLRQLGRGTFGVVWLAERRTTLATTQVALKLPVVNDPNLDEIKHEARVWVQASGHPNIMPVIEAEVYDGQVVIVSEFAPDGSLADWLKLHGRLAPSVEAAVGMTCGILAGLVHLHGRRIIHRDLKPANVLIQGNMPRIADFGLARVLKSGILTQGVAGTPAYMAPEAWDGQRTEQTDLWSAGIILYELLVGYRPFAESDHLSLWKAIQGEPYKNLPERIPNSVVSVVERALQKDPSRRYASATEMLEELNLGVRAAPLLPEVKPSASDSWATAPPDQVPESSQILRGLEVVAVRCTDDWELDVLLRNLDDQPAIIHQISLTVLEDHGACLPMINPSAAYDIPIADLREGQSRSIDVSHYLDPHGVDRFKVALHTTASLILRLTLRYNRRKTVEGLVGIHFQLPEEFGDEKNSNFVTCSPNLERRIEARRKARADEAVAAEKVLAEAEKARTAAEAIKTKACVWAPEVNPDKPRFSQYFQFVCPFCSNSEEVGLWFTSKTCPKCNATIRVLRRRPLVIASGSSQVCTSGAAFSFRATPRRRSASGG